MRKALLLFLAVSVVFSSCKKTYMFQYVDVNCKGRGQGGTKQISIATRAGSKKDLLESAKRDALHALIFRGITLGNGECPSSPIIPNSSEVDAKHKAFFDQFFSSPSMYSQYVLSASLQAPPGAMKLSEGGYRATYVVTVNYDQLVKYLENQGVSRSLKNGL
jgi:hypothetical protein